MADKRRPMIGEKLTRKEAVDLGIGEMRDYQDAGISTLEYAPMFLTGTGDAVNDALRISRDTANKYDYSDDDRTEDTLRHILLGGLAEVGEEDSIFGVKNFMGTGLGSNIASTLIDAREVSGNPESEIDLNNNEFGRQLRQNYPNREEFISKAIDIAQQMYAGKEVEAVNDTKPQLSYGALPIPERAKGGISMAQEGQAVLPMTEATSDPQGGGPKAANPAAKLPLVAPPQQAPRPGSLDPRDEAVKTVAQEMQKDKQQAPMPLLAEPVPNQAQMGGLAAPEQTVPMMAKGGTTEESPSGLSVMIGLGAPSPADYEQASEGNPPPGATKSEVADDQLVLLSEGELVVPANVVRYHGLGAYEGMRREALMGLQDMENNGQIEYVKGGAEKADPIDEDGGLIKANAGTVVLGAPQTTNLGAVTQRPIQYSTPQAASAQYMTTPASTRTTQGLATPTSGVMPFQVAGMMYDPITGLPLTPQQQNIDQPTPTTQTQYADVERVVAPNVGDYTQSLGSQPTTTTPDPAPAPSQTSAPAPSTTTSDGGDDDNNSGFDLQGAASALGYKTGESTMPGLIGAGLSMLGLGSKKDPVVGSTPKGYVGPGASAGALEAANRDLVSYQAGDYGTADAGTGAIYGHKNIPGVGDEAVAQGFSPVDGSKMAVFSGVPSPSYMASGIAKAFGPAEESGYVPQDYNTPTPLGQQGLASALDVAISNTKGYDITSGDDDGSYSFQKLSPEALGFTKSRATYSDAAKNTGVVGTNKGDIQHTAAGVGVVTDSKQIATPTGTVVQVTFKDGTTGSLLGDEESRQKTLDRYNEEKGGSTTRSRDTTPATSDDGFQDAPSSSSGTSGDSFDPRGDQISSSSSRSTTTTDDMVAAMQAGMDRAKSNPNPQGSFDVASNSTTASDASPSRGSSAASSAASYNDKDGLPSGGSSNDSGGGSGDSKDKVICTAMHNMAGFGTYRNKLWQTYAAHAYKNDYVQLGYHKVFADMSKKMYNNNTLANVLGYFARNRTVFIRNKMRNKPNSLGSVILWNTIEGGLYLLGAAISRGWIKKKEL